MEKQNIPVCLLHTVSLAQLGSVPGHLLNAWETILGVVPCEAVRQDAEGRNAYVQVVVLAFNRRIAGLVINGC